MANKKSKLQVTDSSENPAEIRLIQELSGNGYPSIIADDLKLLHELQVLHHETELQNEELRSDQVRFELLSTKYNEFFEFAPYGYFILDTKGLIEGVNLTGATLLGQNRTAIVNKEFLKLIPANDQEIFKLKWADLIVTQKRQVCEVRMFRPDGKRLYVRLALSAAIHQDEFQILMAATDITVEKQIEETQSFLLGCNWAKLGKDFFEYLAEYLANTLGMDYVCIDRLLDNGLEAETVAIYFDGQYEDNVTYSLKDTPCGDVVGNEVCCFPNNVRNLFPHDIVLQEMRAESYLGVTLWGTNGKPVGLIAIIGRKPLVDIKLTQFTLKQVAIRAASELEHRQVEEELKKKDARLHAILESAMDGFWLTDAEGRFIEVNNSYCRMSGYTFEELRQMKISDLESIETSEETESHIRKIFENGEDRFESIHRRKDGSVFNVEVSVQYRPVDGGQFVSFLHDITKRKQSEEIKHNLLSIVQQERDKLSSLINNMTDEVWFADANKKITLVNPSVLNEFGDNLINTFEIDKFIGSLDIFRPDGSPLPVEESPTLRALKGEVVQNFEEIVRIPSTNQMRYREKNSSPVKDDNGNILGAVTVIRDITERKLIEQALKEAQIRTTNILNSIADTFYSVDNNWRFTVVNAAAEQAPFGRPAAKLIGKVIWDEYPNLVGTPIQKRYFNAAATNCMEHYESQSPLNNKWYEVFMQGRKDGVDVYMRDVTERKKAEEALLKNNARLNLAMSVANMAWWEMNIVTGNIVFEKRKAEMLGYSPENFKHYTDFMKLVHPEDAERAMESMRKHIHGKEGKYEVEYRILANSGEYKWFYDIGSVTTRDEKEKSLIVTGLVIDITDRKLNEEALIQAKEDWERTFNAIPDLISIIDHDHRIIRANQAMYDRIKMRKNQCIGTHCYEIMHKTDGPPDFCPHSKLLVDGQMHEAEFFEHHLDGDFLVTTTPLFNPQGQVIASVHVARDITERKKAEDALRKSEEKLQTLYSSMSEGVAIHDIVYENDKAVDYMITDINPAFEMLTGLVRSKTIGKKATGLYGTGNPPYLDIYSRVADGEPSEFFEVYFPPMEKYFAISVFSPGKGKFATVFNDITERKKKEETLHKLNQTLAALGKSSQAMVYSEDEAKYMQHVCDIIAEDCGFAMVWIGVAEEDEAKSVRPVACAGFEDGYLDTLNVSWADDTDRGHGPTGTAIRTGAISMCWDMQTDPNFEPWRAEALKRGYASSIVFPLMSGNKAFGAITIYSKKAEKFEKEEIKLLSELTSDLSHGITSIRLRAAHKQAEEELFKSHSKLEMVVKERTRELQITNEMLHNEIKIRVKQEQSLVLAEEKYRTVADFTYNWETWIDPHGKFIYVSPSCYTITGYTVEEFMDDPNLITKIAHPDDREMVVKHYQEEHQPTISNWSVDFRIIARNGAERWIGHSCRPVFNADGKWIGQRGSNRDITEQKKAEKVLIDSKNHLRELTQRMDAVAEDERIRISREIHDELGHLLTALKFDIEDLSSKTDLPIELIKIELEGMVSMVEALIDSVRKIATELRPGILDHLGLFPAIEWKIKEFRLRNKICCEYNIGDMEVDFDKNETTIIYRILQEIFTNVVRHSKADKIWVEIDKKDSLFILSVTDDGVGFEIDDSNHFGSLGLMGMRERALSIGGEIQIESAPGKGTTVKFLLKKD